MGFLFLKDSYEKSTSLYSLITTNRLRIVLEGDINITYFVNKILLCTYSKSTESRKGFEFAH